MFLLAIDTSSILAGVSIIKDGELLYEANAITKYTHSVNIMPMIEEALIRIGIEISQIDLLAVVTGPGSFTGVRIGVSLVKGLAQGLNIPCIPINALDALAYGSIEKKALICPILDARRQQVYGACFQGYGQMQRLLSDKAIKLDEYTKKILEFKGDKFYFVGDGVKQYSHEIKMLLGDKAIIPRKNEWFLRSSSVGLLAWSTRDVNKDYLSLEPYYLRAPQAEREFNKKHKS